MLRRAVAAVALLAAATTVIPASVLPATGQEDDPSAPDHLVVVRQTPWVPPGGTFALRLRVDDPPDDAHLRVSLHAAVRTRSGFARTLEGRSLGSVVQGARVTTPLDELPVDADGAVQVRLPTGTVTGEEPLVTLDAEDEGVYPVVVELFDGDDVLTDRLITHLLRLPNPDPEEHALAAAVVLPLHAAPSHIAPGEIDTGALAPLHVTVDALLEHPSVPLTLLPTPEALAAAVAVDATAAARLMDATAAREVLDSTWVRLDELAWADAGLDVELDEQRAAGDDALAAVLGRGPATDDAVVDEGGGIDHAAALADEGADTIVVEEADLEPLDGDDFPVTLTRPFRVPVDTTDEPETVTAVMADAALGAHAGSTGDSVLDAHHLLADLAVLALDAPVFTRMAAVVLDDDAATDTAFLGALLAGLDQPQRVGAAPLVVPRTVDASVDAVDPASSGGGFVEDEDDADDVLVREFVDDDAASSRLNGLVADLAAMRADVQSYRTVFGQDDPVAADVDEVRLTAGAESLSDTARGRMLAASRDDMRVKLDAIHAPPRQRVTLTAREGQIQLVLGNDSGSPADVTLLLRGVRLEFPEHEDGTMEVTLREPTTRIDLDVRARTSGDAPLDLRVTSPDGRFEMGRTRVTVRTTAVSGVGVVLMSAAALFLVVWWTRTILRERGKPKRRPPAHAARR